MKHWGVFRTFHNLPKHENRWLIARLISPESSTNGNPVKMSSHKTAILETPLKDGYKKRPQRDQEALEACCNCLINRTCPLGWPIKISKKIKVINSLISTLQSWTIQTKGIGLKFQANLIWFRGCTSPLKFWEFSLKWRSCVSLSHCLVSAKLICNYEKLLLFYKLSHRFL